MNNPHTSIDPVVDRVLVGLRDAQPQTGMQDRILEQLEKRQQEAEKNPFAAFRMTFLRAGFAAIFISAVSGVSVWLHQAATRKDISTAHSMRIVPSMQTIKQDTTKEAALRVEVHGAVHAASKRKSAAHEEATDLTPEEASLMDDMHAPSQPAPALPLNRQERQLLLLGRQGEREDVAMVSPVTLPFTKPGEEKEFEHFFERPPLRQSSQPAADATAQKNGDFQ